MKALAVSLAVTALVQLSAASPYPRDLQDNEKRAVYTAIEWVTTYAPDVVVYADENGVATATSVAMQATVMETVVTAIASPIAQPEVNQPPANRQFSSNRLNIASPTPIPSPSPSPSPAPAPAPAHAPEVAPPVMEEQPADVNSKYSSIAAGVQRSNGYGISWTPFNGDESNTSCKSQEQANDEFAQLQQSDFAKVRIYGVGCNQVALALNAAQKNGLRVMLGIWDIDHANGESQNLVGQVESTGLGWGLVDSVSVGNEDVEKGRSVHDVRDALNDARGVLRAAGYDGPVVHVDTASAFLRHPSLCGADGGDYVAANIHPFFNPAIAPSAAGFFVSAQVGLLRACSALHNWKRSTHRVVVTETGWPNAGGSNGLAVPGRSQQSAAINSIKHHLPNDVYLYSAFDNHWLRDNVGTYGVEKHWGLFSK